MFGAQIKDRFGIFAGGTFTVRVGAGPGREDRILPGWYASREANEIAWPGFVAGIVL